MHAEDISWSGKWGPPQISTGPSATGYYSTLLDFTAVDANSTYYWLRSAGRDFAFAGVVYNGCFRNHDAVFGGHTVRPALAIQLD